MTICEMVEYAHRFLKSYNNIKYPKVFNLLIPLLGNQV